MAVRQGTWSGGRITLHCDDSVFACGVHAKGGGVLAVREGNWHLLAQCEWWGRLKAPGWVAPANALCGDEIVSLRTARI